MVAVARDLVPDGVLTGVLAGGDGSAVMCAVRAILHRAVGGRTGVDECLRLAGVGQSGDRCRRGAGGACLGDGEFPIFRCQIGTAIIIQTLCNGKLNGVVTCLLGLGNSGFPLKVRHCHCTHAGLCGGDRGGLCTAVIGEVCG